jgi:hypothetical protein
MLFMVSVVKTVYVWMSYVIACTLASTSTLVFHHMGHMFYKYKYSRAELGMMATLFLHPNISTYVYPPTSYCMDTNLMSVNTELPITCTCTGHLIALLRTACKRVSNFGLGILTS